MNDYSSFSKAYTCLILTLGWAHSNKLDRQDEIWNTFFLMTERLWRIRYPQSSKKLIPCTEIPSIEKLTLEPHQNTEIPSGITYIHKLPSELLAQIFEYLSDSQPDLAHVLKVCRKWSSIVLPILYKNPELRSRKAIQSLIFRTESHDFIDRRVSTLFFAPSQNGSLIGDDDIPEINGILSSHSCLYRMILQDRQSVQGLHPVFLAIPKKFKNLKFLRETFPQGTSPSTFANSPASFFPDSSQRAGFTMSDYILTRLQRLTKRIQETPDWLDIDPLNIQSICILILDIFQSESGWKSHLAPGALRRAKEPTISRVKEMLNLLSGALLLQVQYITISSQRLLDAYCLIYYEALDISGSLDCNILENIWNKVKESAMSYPYAREAQCIYNCLGYIFKRPKGLLDDEKETFKSLDMTIVQSSLTSFPPSGVNTETIEFLENEIGMTSFMLLNWQDEEGEEIYKWKKWIETIIRWHKASKQMEPVKELLRGNMTKIDTLRGVQRRYGVVFMD